MRMAVTYLIPYLHLSDEFAVLGGDAFYLSVDRCRVSKLDATQGHVQVADPRPQLVLSSGHFR